MVNLAPCLVFIVYGTVSQVVFHISVVYFTVLLVAVHISILPVYVLVLQAAL